MPDTLPVLNVLGDRVALGPLRRDLIPLYNRWFNDWAITETLEDTAPERLDDTERWYDRSGRSDPRDQVTFTVYDRATMRPIGTTNLHQIDHFHRTALFSIVIGEREVWGRGLGTETARLMLTYAFQRLGVHTVRLTVRSYNERAIRAYTRAGFREIGRWRQAHRRAGQAHDVVYMDCLADEFCAATTAVDLVADPSAHC
jgi:RimJ/RimL family protein N-acetyltransferase